jgi:hypothetical protein
MPFLAPLAAPLLAGLSAGGTAAAVGASAAAPILTGASLLAPAVTGASLAGATFAPLAAVGTGATLGSVASGAAGAIGGALPLISTGMQLFSGIGGKMQQAQSASAEARALEQQAKINEQRQIQRGQSIIAKEHANAAASGLAASSGSPLATTIDSTRDLMMNAADARRSGELQAYSRRLQAQGDYVQIPGILADDLLKLRPTVLSSFMSR